MNEMNFDNWILDCLTSISVTEEHEEALKNKIKKRKYVSF